MCLHFSLSFVYLCNPFSVTCSRYSCVVVCLSKDVFFKNRVLVTLIDLLWSIREVEPSPRAVTGV